MRLGELLIQQGQLNESQLRTALRTQEFFGGHLGSILIDLGFIQENALGETLSRAAGVRYAPPDLLEDIPEQVVQALPGKVADRHKAIPIRIEKKRLHLAMLNPKDLVGLDEISYLTGMVVVPYVAPEFRIFRALERYYGVQRLRPDRISISGKIEPEAVLPESRDLPPRTASTADSILPAGVGLDGLPLDAEIRPEGTASISGSVDGTDVLLEQLPRSLDEWREGGENGQAPPNPPPAAWSRPSHDRDPASREAAAGEPAPAPSPPPVGAVGPRHVPESRDAGEPLPGGATDPLREAADRFQSVENRDDVAEILLTGFGHFFRRRMLFFLQRDRIVGWDGRGDGVVRERVKDVLLPTEALSMFTAVKDGGRPFRGPVTDLPTNRRLYDDLGISSPGEVLLVPITLKGRVVSVIYGDNDADPVGAVDLSMLGRLALQAAIALEVLILKNKLQSI